MDFVDLVNKITTLQNSSVWIEIRVLETFIFRPNMILNIDLCCILIITVITRILQTNLLCKLMITLNTNTMIITLEQALTLVNDFEEDKEDLIFLC